MSTLKGIVSLLLLTLNTLFWAVPLIALTLLKLVTPGRPLRRRCSRAQCHRPLVAGRQPLVDAPLAVTAPGPGTARKSESR